MTCCTPRRARGAAPDRQCGARPHRARSIVASLADLRTQVLRRRGGLLRRCGGSCLGIGFRGLRGLRLSVSRTDAGKTDCGDESETQMSSAPHGCPQVPCDHFWPIPLPLELKYNSTRVLCCDPRHSSTRFLAKSAPKVESVVGMLLNLGMTPVTVSQCIPAATYSPPIIPLIAGAAKTAVRSNGA